MSWCPLSVIYIMLPKWRGLAEPLYAAWSTCYAASARRTTPSASTTSSTLTCSGGTSSCLSGMVSASGCFLACFPTPTCKSPRMRLGFWRTLHWQWANARIVWKFNTNLGTSVNKGRLFIAARYAPGTTIFSYQYLQTVHPPSICTPC